MLASVEKGSKEEYDLKVKSIQTAYQLELEEARKQVMNEKDKTKLLKSITEKYYKEEEDAYKEHKNKLIDEQTKAIEDRYKEKVLKTQIESNGTDELGVLRLQYEEKQALLEAAQQKEGETIEEFNARKLQMEWEAKQKKTRINRWRNRSRKSKISGYFADDGRFRSSCRGIWRTKQRTCEDD